jgi:murein DD-endopeptidase MepM/ murein hydrolase activator NlpD
MPFPLPFMPAGYKTGGRKFGADRPNGRRHAGSDLTAPLGTPIFAVADGLVLDPPRDFYHGTWAFSVNHGGYVVRYCEISSHHRKSVQGSVTVPECEPERSSPTLGG